MNAATQRWPGLSLDWTEEEQRSLESLMLRFTPERMDPVQRYVRIAAALPQKSIRDVALRIQWANQMKRQRQEAHTGNGAHAHAHAHAHPHPHTHAHGRGMRGPGGVMAMQPNLGIVTPPLLPLMGDGSPTVDGPIAYLLDANMSILNQFRTNMASFKVHENTQLLVQFRDNILQVLHAMDSMGGVMASLPPLPVSMNVDMANEFLPSRPAGYFPLDNTMAMVPPPTLPEPAINAPGMIPLSGLGN